MRTPVHLVERRTGEVAWKRFREYYWASLMVLLTSVVSIGAVGPFVGPWLRKLSDGKLIVHGQLAYRRRQVLSCTHFTPDRYIHHWGVFEGHSRGGCSGPNVSGGPLMTTSQSAFGHQ